MGRTSTSAPCALLFADPLFSRLQQSHSQSVQWLQRAFLPHTEFYRNHISAGRHRGLRRENEKTSLKRLLYETVVVWLLGGLGKGLLWKTKQKNTQWAAVCDSGGRRLWFSQKQLSRRSQGRRPPSAMLSDPQSAFIHSQTRLYLDLTLTTTRFSWWCADIRAFHAGFLTQM